MQSALPHVGGGSESEYKALLPRLRLTIARMHLCTVLILRRAAIGSLSLPFIPLSIELLSTIPVVAHPLLLQLSSSGSTRKEGL